MMLNDPSAEQRLEALAAAMEKILKQSDPDEGQDDEDSDDLIDRLDIIYSLAHDAMYDYWMVNDDDRA